MADNDRQAKTAPVGEAARDAENGAGNGDPEIVLPAGKRLVPVNDIPRLISDALYPPASDGQEMTISYLQQATPKHPGGEWLSDEHMALLNKTIWAHLPPYWDGITASQWAPYYKAFKSNQSSTELLPLREAMRDGKFVATELLPIWKNPALDNGMARADSERQHAEMLREAMSNGKIVCVTHAGVALRDAFMGHGIYVTVPELRRYAERMPIPVRVRVAEQTVRHPEVELRQPDPASDRDDRADDTSSTPQRTRREDELTPIIQEVVETIEQEGGAVSTATVYPRLQAIAGKGQRPFTGEIGKSGLYWRDGRNGLRKLNKDALRNRLGRRRPLPNAR